MASANSMQRVMITLPPSLLAQLEEAATRMQYSRSQLIREAVEQFLETQRRQELRDLLKEGYLANAERDLRSAEEFAASDYETVVRHVPFDSEGW